MASYLFHGLRRIRLHSLLETSSLRSILRYPEPSFAPLRPLNALNQSNPLWVFKNFSHGSVNLVISEGKPRFETHEIDPPKKEKWLTKKRLKIKRKKEKQKRKSANKRDPRRLGVKGKKGRQRFANAEERIKYKLEKAKIKEGLLLERLKHYEVSKLQGPLVKPHELTGEERFYMKKVAQKGSNYVPVGRRGVFGGVILNMHMHWKKHETVKVICKPCKPGQLKEYADDIARLSGGIAIHLIGDDTIIFYRGKDYVQPKVMSPIDTLSKKRHLEGQTHMKILFALEKSKYEQSLESVRRFIAIAEKELELYYRHIALYGDPSNGNPNNTHDSPRKGIERPKKVQMIEKDSTGSGFTVGISGMETDSTSDDLSESEGDYGDGDLSLSDLDKDDGTESDSCDEEKEDNSSNLQENSNSMLGSRSSVYQTSCMDSYNQEFMERNET